jgi:hypothetical protein
MEAHPERQKNIPRTVLLEALLIQTKSRARRKGVRRSAAAQSSRMANRVVLTDFKRSGDSLFPGAVTVFNG